jgi:hypothetical protein
MAGRDGLELLLHRQDLDEPREETLPRGAVRILVAFDGKGGKVPVLSNLPRICNGERV